MEQTDLKPGPWKWADLRSAAPDLYAALEDMVSGVYSAESVPCGCIGCKTDRAKAALAKARGEAPEDRPQ